MARSIRASMMRIFCPRKNPKIQESCKSKAIRRTGAKGQLKNARRNKKRLGFNLPPPSLRFFGFSNGLSIGFVIPPEHPHQERARLLSNLIRQGNRGIPAPNQRGVVIEQDQGAADGTARQHIAVFVFLEGTRPATDQLPRLFLGQAQLLTDSANFLGSSRPST